MAGRAEGSSFSVCPCMPVAGRGEAGAGVVPGSGFSSLEATRVMGGNCGGKGDMGELET